MNFPNNILVATSTIADGNMSFRFGAKSEVVANRRSFLEQNDIAFANHIAMACDNSDIIATVDRNNYDDSGDGQISSINRTNSGSPGRHFGAGNQEDMIEAEVLVTQEKSLALMVLTADCIPGVFYDPIREVLALAHLNRRTIALELGKKTVGYLSENFGSKPEDLLVYFGPHIKKESYVYRLPLTDPTPPALQDFIVKHSGQAHINITGAEIKQLNDAGVKRDNISVSEINVATSPDHFSYYQSKHDEAVPMGRMATVAMICS